MTLIDPSWNHAVATRSRRRRGYGFNGKGGVGGARKYDGQLLTALCGGNMNMNLINHINNSANDYVQLNSCGC